MPDPPEKSDAIIVLYRQRAAQFGEQKERFAERQRQVELAKARGLEHVAADQSALREKKRLEREAQIAKSIAGEKTKAEET